MHLNTLFNLIGYYKYFGALHLNIKISTANHYKKKPH
jgi:hypothetical protein